MGKLRFTLTYVLFWLILGFAGLLAENYAVFTDNPLNGFSTDSLIVFSLFVIALLIVYYVLEHRKNGLTFDKVLLPILIIYGGLCIATVWWQGPRIFINIDDNFTSSVSFSNAEKMSYTLQIVVWFAVLYGMLFAFNRFSMAKKWMRLFPIVYVALILIGSIADVIMEFDSIVAIFTSTYTGPGLKFIINNENVWAHFVLVGILSCIVLNIRKFRPYYYAFMFLFFIVILFTTSATATFVAFTVIALYTFFEILTNIRGGHLKRQMILMSIYLVGLGLLFGGIALMIRFEVPAAVNFWSFVSKQILEKDYSTLTSRTGIWATLFKFFKGNPVDLVFGLGYKTGNTIFTQYYLTSYSHGFAPNSMHNGFLEILLRHGIIGVTIYITLLVLFGKGIIKLLIHKQYRIAFFYGICVAGLLAHGIAESTTFFTPNGGGLYATIVFFIPVLNANKLKYFDQLNDDLKQLEIEELKVANRDVFYYINTIFAGLLIASGLAFTMKSLYYSVATVIICTVVCAISFVGLLLIPLLAFSINRKQIPFKECFLSFVWSPIKNNIVAIVSSLIAGFLLGSILQQLFEVDTFVILLFAMSIFIAYYLVFVVFNKKENCVINDALDNLLLKRLKYMDSEAINNE